MSIPVPTPLQLWLSNRPTSRTEFHSGATFVGLGGAVECHFVKEENGKTYAYEKHIVSKDFARGGADKPTKAAPPPHIHLGQSEHFEVLSGKVTVMKNGVRETFTKGDRMSVEVGTPHTFWSVEDGGNMEVKINVDPEEEDGFSERFLRNFHGYMNDCEKYKIAPSPFQLTLFMYSAGMVLATPLPLFLNKCLHHVMAYWVAEWLLGYRAHYPEYYLDKKSA